MGIQCRCSSCDTQFKVADKHSGHRVKCPKCSGIIVVPAIAQPLGEEPPVGKESDGPESDASSAVVVAPEAVVGPKTPSQRKPPKRREVAGRVGEESDAAVAAGIPKIDVGAPRASADVTAPAASAEQDDATGPPRKKKNLTPWLIGGGIAGGALLVLLVVIAVIYSGNDEPSRRARKKSHSSARSGYFVLDWPGGKQGSADSYEVRVNGKVVKGKAGKGGVRFTLKSGRHKVEIRRRGFDPVEIPSLAIKTGETHHYTPAWEQSFAAMEFPAPGQEDGFPVPQAAPTFDDWLQDFEAAKAKAAKEDKHILIAFDGSDWCPPSIKLAEEILLRREFRWQVDKDYVLVFVDFPRKAEAKAKVQDKDRNKKLAKHFDVDSYPTIVLTDAEGRPFGFEGYTAGGVEEFVESLVEWQGFKTELDAAFLEVETLQDKNKMRAIQRALAVLQKLDNYSGISVLRFYEPTLNGWLEAARKLDPGNKSGDLEKAFAAVWKARLLAAAQAEDKDRVAKIVGQLDQWKKKHEFKDRDRAATLHLYAAGVLANLKQNSAASKYIEDGLAYKPPDRMIREQLQRGAQAIEGMGVGTGFVVGANGYILTNHHVIESPGRTFVQLTRDKKTRVPARVITMDADGDMALLKVEIPEGIELKPLPISTARVRRGASVGAFGYPGSGAVGTGLKITTGVVSSLPADTPDKMVLLDCTVNPGNSGGPLCDSYGNVIGMVTAKSLSSRDTESYGMALPADKLKEFLMRHLPKASQPPPAKVLEDRLHWDEINDMVEKSVLMIVRRM